MNRFTLPLTAVLLPIAMMSATIQRQAQASGFENHAIGLTAPQVADGPEIDHPGIGNQEVLLPTIVGFERRTFSVERLRGRVMIDGVTVARHFVESRPESIRLIEVFDGLQFKGAKEFRQWARSLRSKRTYTYDVVFTKREGAPIEETPLVLMQGAQRLIANAAWEGWLAERNRLAVERANAEAIRLAERKHDATLEALAQRQADALQEIRTSNQALLDRNDRWTVRLIPSESFEPGFSTRRFEFKTGNVLAQPQAGFSVNVTARNSLAAADIALAKYPGHRFGGATKRRYR